MVDVDELEEVEGNRRGRTSARGALAWHEHPSNFVGVHSIQSSLANISTPWQPVVLLETRRVGDGRHLQGIKVGG